MNCADWGRISWGQCWLARTMNTESADTPLHGPQQSASQTSLASLSFIAIQSRITKRACLTFFCCGCCCCRQGQQTLVHRSNTGRRASVSAEAGSWRASSLHQVQSGNSWAHIWGHQGQGRAAGKTEADAETLRAPSSPQQQAETRGGGWGCSLWEEGENNWRSEQEEQAQAQEEAQAQAAKPPVLPEEENREWEAQRQGAEGQEEAPQGSGICSCTWFKFMKRRNQWKKKKKKSMKKKGMSESATPGGVGLQDHEE